jgi:hypothetical protein
MVFMRSSVREIRILSLRCARDLWDQSTYINRWSEARGRTGFHHRPLDTVARAVFGFNAIRRGMGAPMIDQRCGKALPLNAGETGTKKELGFPPAPRRIQ